MKLVRKGERNYGGKYVSEQFVQHGSNKTTGSISHV